MSQFTHDDLHRVHAALVLKSHELELSRQSAIGAKSMDLARWLRKDLAKTDRLIGKVKTMIDTGGMTWQQ